ncbi:MAG: energy transducer TonB [Candidatus Brocadiia bacterium]
MNRDLLIAVFASLVVHAAALPALPLHVEARSGTGTRPELVVLGVVRSAASPHPTEASSVTSSVPSTPSQPKRPAKDLPRAGEPEPQPKPEEAKPVRPRLPDVDLPQIDLDHRLAMARRRAEAAAETLASAWQSLRERAARAAETSGSRKPDESRERQPSAGRQPEAPEARPIPSVPSPPPTPARRRTPAPSTGSRARPGSEDATRGANRQVRAEYLAEVLSRVQAAKFYPLRARRRREHGTVKVRFTIRATGELGTVKVCNSSGRSGLDRAAVQTVRRAAPFSPFPDALRAHELHVVVPIVYQLR